MSYCLNPACTNPQNSIDAEICRTCGSKLLLRERYRVIKALGQGGFGATFLALDKSLPGEPTCVIKQLRPTTTEPQVLQMARELFEREARTLGKIGNHPQVPRLLDYFEHLTQFYLVQEYVSGLTLQQEIRRDGPLSEAGVKHFLSEMVPVIQYIHSQQVIHRDIKPANMIRREQDRKLVLIDFGAVKNQVSATTSSSNSDQTALTAYAIGTPGFAPPEQMAMRPVYASDIYALGVTCIYLLTGKSPKDLDYNPSTGEMIWLNKVNISEHFANVIKKMVEVSVRHRYQSADQILKALDLEPYLDSLAQGLAAKPTSNSNQIAADNPNSSSSQSLQFRNLNLDKIRARKARLDPDGVKGNSGLENRNSLVHNNVINHRTSNKNTSTDKPKVPVKLDVKTILTFYAKGRRDFASQELNNLNLQKVNLSGGSFHQSQLVKTNFQGANLSNADFGYASLEQAILRDANLVRTYFSCANLENADLRGADLSYANLNNANLRGTNLCGANLTGAKVSDEQLEQAKTNWSTVLPHGKRGWL